MTRAIAFAGLLLLGACAGPKTELPQDAAVTAPVAWRGGEARAGAVTADW